MTGWSGRRARRTVALVLEHYGDRCHLCGHGGADSADHVIPRVQRPDLTWDLGNLRPAHHRPCPTCGVHCNSSRGDRPLSSVRVVTDTTEYVDA